MSDAEPTHLAKAVAGRSCGACSLCCKLPQIDPLDKPAGAWCRHCAPGKGGCKIYDTRPTPCREFMCLWMTASNMGDEWTPTTAKMYVSVSANGKRIGVLVDPSSPGQWMKEPYYSQIKHWSRTGATSGIEVLIHIRDRVVAILPNKDVDLGAVGPHDRIMIETMRLPSGPDWRAFVTPAGAPPA